MSDESQEGRQAVLRVWRRTVCQTHLRKEGRPCSECGEGETLYTFIALFRTVCQTHLRKEGRPCSECGEGQYVRRISGRKAGRAQSVAKDSMSDESQEGRQAVLRVWRRTVCQTHLRKEGRPCSECGEGETLYTFIALFRTVCQTHLRKEGRPCSECGEVFHREDLLLEHMNVHLNQFSMVYDEDNKTELHCMLEENIIDPSTFLTENSLLVPREPVPVSMISNVSMTSNASADAERRHECNVCHKRFKRRQHLKVHYNTHTRTEPLLRCLKCHKENSLLVPREPVPVSMISNVSMTSNASADAERRHECNVCHKRFKRRQHLKVHYNTHTRTEPLLRCL
ncbi:RB-associated KRAB zinc finger protein, partial [Operophtera brumata]